MRKHRTVQVVGILIIVAAVAYLALSVLGIVLMDRGALGGGWSAGWRGWITLPALIAAVFGFATLLVFGSILFFLAQIDTNLSVARQNVAKQRAPLGPAPAPAMGQPVAAPEADEHAAPGATPVPGLPPTSVTTAAAIGPLTPQIEAPAEAEPAEPQVEAAAPEAEPVVVEAERPTPAVAAAASAVATEKPEVEPILPEVEAVLRAPETGRAGETPATGAAGAEPAQAEEREPDARSGAGDPSAARATSGDAADASELPLPGSALPTVEIATVEEETAPLPARAQAPMQPEAPDDDLEALRKKVAELRARFAQIESGQAAEPESPQPAGSVADEAAPPGKLPGADEVARIASEMDAIMPPKHRPPASE